MEESSRQEQNRQRDRQTNENKMCVLKNQINNGSIFNNFKATNIRRDICPCPHFYTNGAQSV